MWANGKGSRILGEIFLTKSRKGDRISLGLWLVYYYRHHLKLFSSYFQTDIVQKNFHHFHAVICVVPIPYSQWGRFFSLSKATQFFFVIWPKIFFKSRQHRDVCVGKFLYILLLNGIIFQALMWLSCGQWAKTIWPMLCSSPLLVSKITAAGPFYTGLLLRIRIIFASWIRIRIYIKVKIL